MILNKVIEFQASRRKQGGFKAICKEHSMEIVGWSTTEIAENARIMCNLRLPEGVKIKISIA